MFFIRRQEGDLVVVLRGNSTEPALSNVVKMQLAQPILHGV
jgi:hypothetical protein